MTDNLKVRELEAYPMDYDGRKMVSLSDPERLGDNGMIMSLPGFYLITMMDGTRDNEQILADFQAQFGQSVPMEELQSLIAQLDESYLLDNQRYVDYRELLHKQFLDNPTRPAVFAGKSYSDNADELQSAIDEMIEKSEPGGEGDLQAIIVPHIDFSVGGDMMATGWCEVMETDADLFVILGIGHTMSDDFFSCIDKDFETPLGTMEVDRDFLSRLKLNFGEDLYNYMEAHKSEHSIEFQSLFMAWLAKKRPGIKAVPILLSYPEMVWNMDHPVFNGKRIDKFIKALGRTIKSDNRKVVIVASVDFSHVGVRFGDQAKLSDEMLSSIEKDDRTLIGHIGDIDASAFLNKIEQTNPTNRVCGFPALYTLLKLTDAKSGKLSEYRQNIEGDMETMVSFASMSLFS